MIRTTRSLVWILCGIAALGPTLAGAASDVESELLALRALLDAQRADINTLQSTLKAQQELLDEQRIAIAAFQGGPERATQVAVATQATTETESTKTSSSEPQLAELDDTSALQARLDRVEKQLREVPEDPLAAIADDSFPGSWRLPGGNARVRIGGYAKMNIVSSFDPLVSRDRFIVGSIPPEGVVIDGSAAEFALSARQSRVNLDLRDDTDLGAVRAFVEGDFAGDGDTFRLRHAYGQFKQMLAGQTWSTFMDLQSTPEELDFEGINGRINARQPQIRFFPKIAKKLNMKIALEDPRPDVSGGTGISEWPDLVIGVDRSAFGLLGFLDRMEGWSARAAFIARQLEATPFDGSDKEKTAGWGFTASGGIPMSWWTEKDRFFWQFTYGEGIGRYINDLGTLGGYDAIFSPNGKLKTLPVFAGYLSYQHWWAPRWRSNTTFSWVNVDTFDFQSSPAYIEQFGDPYERTLRASLNLLFNPIRRMEIGAELLWGERRNANDTKGDAAQVQFSVRYLY